MGKKQRSERGETATVEVRNVDFDEETDGSIDIWRAIQKKKGKKYKRGEAVAELTKRGLKAEGVIA